MTDTSQALYDALCVRLPGAQLLKSEPMSRHTTMRVGGPADVLLQPNSAEQIREALAVCRELGAPTLLIGNGSNLVVRDGGIRGLVIKLCDTFAETRFSGAKVQAQAGARLIVLARDAIQKGLAGLEFAGGIPGTVGGAVVMNAGAYGEDMKGVLTTVTYIDRNLDLVRHVVQEGDMEYRSTVFSSWNVIITGAEFSLRFDTDGEARRRYDDYNKMRREKQPLSYPSAGSFFKRPPGHYAGKLIEDAGLKGASEGGAMISQMHAGFLINTGNATAADVLGLCARVQQTVLDRFGVRLEPEVRIVGEDAG